MCQRGARLHLGREPTIEEIAGELGASKEEVAASIEAGAEVESSTGRSTKMMKKSILLIDKIEEESSAQEELLNRMVLRELLTGLSDKGPGNHNQKILL